MKLRAFCDVLEKLAPTRHAAKWDNVGLLLEPADCFVERVLLTNDLTSRVMKEAVDFKGMFSVIYDHNYPFQECIHIDGNIVFENKCSKLNNFLPSSALPRVQANFTGQLERSNSHRVS